MVKNKLEKTCKDILYCLRKSTYDEPMTVSDVADYCCIRESHPSCPRTRKLIKDTMKLLSVPIGSNRKGFYIIRTGQEMQRYCNSLLKRQVGIVETIDITYEAWKSQQ